MTADLRSLQQARPFLKWAGGKTQLLEALRARVPSTWDPKRDLYVEPFLGGGALYFALRPRRARLGDLNADLVGCWTAVRDHLGQVLEVLRELQGRYRLLPSETYYEIRDWDRGEVDDVRWAARFIFLNKTCFNGLYRVNREGRFNVSWCKNPLVGILDEGNLERCSELLREGEVDIGRRDFEEAAAPAGSLVYLDPPYLPLSKTSNFTGFTSQKFEISDHCRLLEHAVRLSEGGCHVLVSQSGNKDLADRYRQEGFECDLVSAKRMINSAGEGRGAVGEYIIRRISQ